MDIIGYNWKNLLYARENRKNPTKTEWLVRNMVLKGKKTWAKFTRQKMIWPYIADFYCKELNLVIEIDWESHNYKQEYDEKRIKYLKSLWLDVLVYTDEQVLWNLEWICEDINWQVKVRKEFVNKEFLPNGEEGHKVAVGI